MPDGYFAVAGHVDNFVSHSRMLRMEVLPSALAEPLIRMVNDILGVVRYTNKHAVIRLPAQPLHYASWNIPDLEFMVKPGTNVDAGQLRDRLLEWFKAWFEKEEHYSTKHHGESITKSDPTRLFTILDIIVDADRVCGLSYNLRTGQIEEQWDDDKE